MRVRVGATIDEGRSGGPLLMIIGLGVTTDEGGSGGHY